MRKAAVGSHSAAAHTVLHRIHRCRASAGLQLEQIAVDGNAAEKALLADVTEKNPDASYIDLLRLFKVRRSVADAHS